ncbi:hypothetical protein CANCADRAFT_17959, partial [Tortispora caseinolytica NRRL Y-17796]
KYDVPSPNLQDNLINLFGLKPLADSVARTDPITGAKNKLRKSYKGHIADLIGKNQIPTNHTILPLIDSPLFESRPALKPFDTSVLRDAFKFDKSTVAVGFDSSLLGLND